MFITNIWTVIFSLLGSALLLAAWGSSLMTFEITGENIGSIGFFGSEFGFVGSTLVDNNELSELWPSGIPPGIFLTMLTIPVLILTGILLLRRRLTRGSLIGIAAAMWGLAAGLSVVSLGEYTLLKESIADRIGPNFIAELFGVTLEPGDGLMALLASSILLGLSGLVLLAGSRAE